MLIVALILAALIAVGLGSYLNLNLSSSRLARRTFHGYAALNLAEAGAEEAVWSVNRAQAGDAQAWRDWQNNGTSAWQKFDGFNLSPNAGGSVKVFVDTFNPAPGARPKVVTQAAVGVPGEPPVTRMLEVTLRRRSLFAGGLVARESVVFSGAVATVDSWNSDPDNSAATAPVPYAAEVRRDHGTVASTAVTSSAIIVNQASIWGFVATGGAPPQVGANGTIQGADTPPEVRIDPRRVSTDFNAEFPLVPPPLDGTILAAVPPTLGVAGTTTRWRVAAIALSGRQTLTILGDVTIILTAAAGIDALSLTGNSTINIPDGASLTLYIEGNMRLAGNGLANSNVQPASCLIYGTSQSPGGQTLDIAGNGALKCAVYAPNGDVKINGNGDVMGSIVANQVTLVGNAAFHYDESLAARDTNQPFSIAKWRELSTAADRARYESVFQGW